MVDFGRAAIGIGTLGLSELAGEDFMSRVPLLGSLGGYKSDEEKRLMKTQEALAAEAKKRQRALQQRNLNTLGQRLTAFNPQNQLMAQMFGPQAAFTPEQFANMAANPMPQPMGQDFEGRAPSRGERKQQAQTRAEAAQYQMDEENRRQMILQGLSPLPQGPRR